MHVFLATLLAALCSLTNGLSFMTRNGTELLEGTQTFRFCGGNAYWLGLDENVDGVHYPTQFRINDGLYTAASMGLSVVRAHTVGVSTGNPLSFRPSCAVFNDSALNAADFALATAGSLGIRLIVPLTDNYKYYHGGKHDFTDCLGLPEDAFYYDERAIAAFTEYITRRLEHVNPYNGLAAKDDPAILAWETGNELKGPANWTIMIATFIKSLDTNHLILDGHYGIDKGTLGDEHVDLHSDHFYPIDLARLKSGAASTAGAGKVYVAGEYDWTSLSATTSFLQEVNTTTTIGGSAFWSIFPHLDTYGFVQHNDGFTVHFPGYDPHMRSFVDIIHAAAADIVGGSHPAPYFTPLAPLIDNVSGNAMEWRGGAGAGNYSIEISTSGVNGPWSVPCLSCATDDQLPVTVPGGIPDNSWIRVRAFNPDGVPGPYSAVWQGPG